MRVLVAVLCLMWSSWSFASVQIVEIQGNRELVSIKRGETLIPVQEFLALQELDEIYVKESAEEEVKVILDLVGEKQAIVTSHNSPYEIFKTAINTTLINNMQSWVKDLLASKSQNDNATIPVISRGDNGITHLLGMDLQNNIIPANLDQLFFFWEGGQGPFQILIHDLSSETQVFDQEVAGIETSISIPLHSLTGTYYLVEITDLASNIIDSQEFAIVRDKDIPSKIIELEEALSDKNYQLKIACLAIFKDYQFYALQLAKANRDEVLINALLSDLLPIVQ